MHSLKLFPNDSVTMASKYKHMCKHNHDMAIEKHYSSSLIQVVCVWSIPREIVKHDLTVVLQR